MSPSDVGVRAGRFLVDGSCLFSEEVGSIDGSVFVELSSFWLLVVVEFTSSDILVVDAIFRCSSIILVLISLSSF